jgi:hypothetical protein
MGGNLVATQSWVTSQNYLTSVPDEYLTETEGNALYASISHTHSATDITSGTLASARLSGTYAISVSGSAATLTTARTLTIGSTGKTFNGSANVSWTLAEIGAAATSHTHAATDITSGVLADDRLNTTTARLVNFTNPVTIESDSDGILNLKQLGLGGTAGVKNAGWNYIQFLDSEGDRQGYFGIDSAGNFQFASEITGNVLIGGSRVYTVAYHPEADTWTTARTLTIGNTGKSVNGSANVSWTLAEIGALGATAKAADSELLDGIDSSSFLRSDAADSFSAILTGTATGENLRIGGIRGTAKGSQTGEYIHLYERVHIGGPDGWGASTHGAPSYGLSVWGSVDFGMNGAGVIQLDGTTIVTAARQLTNVTNTNWDAAYSWGNHAGLYLGISDTAADSNKLGGIAAASYALLASPALTGTPTTPTAATATNNTQIATTAFVKNQGYLTTESDTLATVTGRGASTSTAVTFNGNVTLGNAADLRFVDLAGTFPTSGKGFDWTLNNDGARIYAIQPSSDSIDLVFQLRDNATTNDRFVFWVDDYQGAAFDKYPLVMRGGTEVDLVDSGLFVRGTQVLTNARNLQNVSGNISMFTNDSGYITSSASITGNAATATTLATARTLTIGNTGKSFNGSANVSWSLAEIGAQAALTNPVTGTGTTNYLPKFTGFTTVGNSQIFDNGTSVGIGTASPNGWAQLETTGTVAVGGILYVKSSQKIQALTGFPGSAGNLSINPDGGNVGIGTTSPAYKLDVNGTIGFPYSGSNANYIEQGNALGYGRIRPFNNSGLFGFDTNYTAGGGYDFAYNGSSVIRVTSAGNVGIGTTNPIYKLHVAGSAYVNSGTLFIDSGEYLRWGNSNQGIRGVNDTSLEFVSGASTRMYISAAGNVGIGTTSPGTGLHVVSGGVASQGTTGINANTAPGVWIGGDGTNALIYGRQSNVWKPTYLDSSALYINAQSGGNVGIGTTSPSTKLHVAGDARITGSRLDLESNTRITGQYYGNGGTEYTYINMYNGGNASINIGTKHPLSYISFESGNGAYTERMRITNTGNVGISTTSPVAKLQVVSTADGSDVFAVDGVNGRLFTVTDDLSDSLFSVNTIAGLPVIEAFADNTVKIGPFGNPVIIDSSGNLSIGGAEAATKAYVDTSISNLIGGAPGALDTLNELAAAINDDASYASTITSALATKAPLASPALTGTPTAPTAATATNTTQIATTAFVKAQGYLTSYSETDTLASVVGRGNTANNKIIINSTGTAGDATLKINTSSSLTFVHSQENFASGLTAGQHNILVVGKEGNTKNSGYIGYYWSSAGSNDNFVTIGHWGADDLFRVYGDGRATVGTNTIWHAGNDGSGSGLDSDLLDGQQGSYYAQASLSNNKTYTSTGNAVGSYLGGHYSSGGTETPNSGTFGAGKLKIAMLSGGNLGFGGSWNDVIWVSSYTGGDVKSSHALVFDKYSSNVWVSDQNYDSATWGQGYQLWHTAHFTQTNINNWNTAYGWGNHASAGYVPGARTITINGTALDLTANRSWTISTITGNAGTATTLQTARTLTIGNTGKSFNGSANVSWTLVEIGAYAATNPSGFITASSLTPYWNYTEVTNIDVQNALVTFIGDVTINGTLTETSSIRFKENIKLLEPALGKVEQLNPVSYNKVGSEQEEIGLIAEEVAELFPEVVTYNEDGQPSGIQYQRLSVILLKAVQELTERVNKLENK